MSLEPRTTLQKIKDDGNDDRRFYKMVCRTHERSYRSDRIDDATAIYYEFEEWLDPDEFNDVVVIDDMNFDE